MEQGTVQRFDKERGFGFIAPDEGGPDIFVHVSGLSRSTDVSELRPGIRVWFSRSHSDKGPKAVQVAYVDQLGPHYVARERDYPEPSEDSSVMPTEAAWWALWEKVSGEAFESLMTHARANGWVVDAAEPEAYQEDEPQREAGELRSPGSVQGVPGWHVHC